MSDFAIPPAPRVWCAGAKAGVDHPPHWHVIRAGNITVAQGQCRGLPEVA